MPVSQRLVGPPSPCSGYQMPSPPSSVCPPSSNVLLPRRGSSPRKGLPLRADAHACFAWFFLALSYLLLVLLHPPLQLSPLFAKRSALSDVHPLTQRFTLPYTRCVRLSVIDTPTRVGSSKRQRLNREKLECVRKMSGNQMVEQPR